MPQTQNIEHCTAKDGLAIAEALRGLAGRKVAVIGHVRPDGDCIGSQVALTRCLNSLGADAIAVNEHTVPRNLSAFVGDTPFFQPEAVTDLSERFIISVDCAAMKRLGPKVCERIAQVAINIDHHISNESFARANYIYPNASAAAEILGCLLVDQKLPIDAVTAQALYVGIYTDTGQFRFASTSAYSFELCCQLIAHGAIPSKAASEIYENEPLSKILLLRAFLDSLRFEYGGRFCVGILPEDIWESTGAVHEQADGMVDYARTIEGVQIGALLEYRKDSVKGSFRAKDAAMRVDLLAAKFNGGGHACAAGFNCDMKPEDFYPAMLKALGEIFEPKA